MASPKAGTYEIRELVGWTAIPVAAERTGLSRQWLSDMANSGKLRTVRKVPGTGVRPAALVMRTAEVDDLIAAKKAAESCLDCRKARNAGRQPEICEHRVAAQVTVPEEEPEPVLA